MSLTRSDFISRELQVLTKPCLRVRQALFLSGSDSPVGGENLDSFASLQMWLLLSHDWREQAQGGHTLAQGLCKDSQGDLFLLVTMGNPGSSKRLNLVRY